jgi:Phosphotransferase enzyme family
LTAVLTTLLRVEGSIDRKVKVLAREPAIFTSTAPSEIVTCRLSDGNKVKLLCKYGGQRSDGYHSRGGVPYEAEVYRNVLQPLDISKANYYGAYQDDVTDKTWLILKYLGRSFRVTKAPRLDAVCLAARWIGRFHAINEPCLSIPSTEFLTVYDENYLFGWSRRTLLLASELKLSSQWLKGLCRLWKEIVNELLLPPTTIIHGEYYPENILIRGKVIYPVDWESAAIAVGEIDLATVTEGWSRKIARQCEFEYQKARWPEGAPADFMRRLDAARLFVEFRWLGDLDYQKDANTLSGFKRLRSAGKRLGFI